jgi:hypothetical protein
MVGGARAGTNSRCLFVRHTCTLHNVRPCRAALQASYCVAKLGLDPAKVRRGAGKGWGPGCLWAGRHGVEESWLRAGRALPCHVSGGRGCGLRPLSLALFSQQSGRLVGRARGEGACNCWGAGRRTVCGPHPLPRPASCILQPASPSPRHPAGHPVSSVYHLV